VDLLVEAKVSENCPISIFKAEDGDSMLLWNVGCRAEDEDSMLLQNIGFYQPIHRTT
jgi:hypothetical protein